MSPLPAIGEVGVVCGVAARAGSSWAPVLAVALVLAPSPVHAEEEPEETSPLSTVIFGSFETGRSKNLISVGLKRAFGAGGLDASGFRLGLKWGESLEDTQPGALPGQIVKTEAHVTLGYEWRIGDTFVALSAGPDLEAVYTQYTGTVEFSQRIGLRLHGDLWTRPSEATLLQANAYLSSLDQRAWLRLSPGWKLWDEIYLGPELEAYRQKNYRKLRLGVHLTGLRLFGLTWRLSAGAQKTSDRKSEAYATLGVYWRR